MKGPTTKAWSSDYHYDKLLGLFTRESYRIHHPAGTTIFSQGESPEVLYLVRSGRVQLTVCERRRQCVVCECRAGDLLALSSAFAGKPQTVTATAVTDTVTDAISRQRFVELLQNDPECFVAALQLLSKELETTQRRIVELGFARTASQPAYR
jgi:CRP-like cAMP-binding protein